MPPRSMRAIRSSVRDGLNVRRRGAKFDTRSDARGDGALVHELCGGDVLKRGPRAIEDNDLVVALAPRSPAGHHVGQLGVHVHSSHHTQLERVMEVANGGALVEQIDHDGAGRQQRRLDLLFLFIVRAIKSSKSSSGTHN